MGKKTYGVACQTGTRGLYFIVIEDGHTMQVLDPEPFAAFVEKVLNLYEEEIEQTTEYGVPLWRWHDYYLYEWKGGYLLYICGDNPLTGTLDAIREHLKDNLGEEDYIEAVKGSVLED